MTAGGSFCHTYAVTIVHTNQVVSKHIYTIETILTETTHTYANTLIHPTCVHNRYFECTE